MEKEGRRGTPAFYRHLRQRSREGWLPSEDSEEEERVAEGDEPGDGRPSRRKLYALWLGTLLSAPTVVAAYVNSWMARSIFGHRRSDGPNETEAFSRLLQMVLIGRSEMHLNLVRKTDAVERTTRVTYEITPLVLLDKHWTPGNFALSEQTLRRALHEIEGEAGELRLVTGLIYLLCNMDQTPRDQDGRDGGGVATKFRDIGMLMRSGELSVDNSHAMLCNYSDQDLVDLRLHRSSFIIAIGRYLLRTRAQLNVEDESVAASPTKSVNGNDSDELFKHAAMRQAQKDALAVLIEQYERTLGSLTSRAHFANKLRPADLTESMRQYDPDDAKVEPERDPDNNVLDSATVAGVPLAAMQSDLATYAWIEWAYHHHVRGQGVPLSRLLADTWTAKSFHLLDSYHAFMERTQHFVFTDMSTLSKTSRNRPLKRRRR